MSEQLLLTPKQQQESASRTLHDAELLTSGATISALGNLVVTAQQQDTLHGEMQNATELTQAERSAAVTSGEVIANRQEFLSSIVKESGAAVHSWFGGQVVEGEGNQFRTVTNGHALSAKAEAIMGKAQTDEVAYTKLNNEGISEIVTITELPNNDTWSNYTLITYELTDTPRKYVAGRKRFKSGIVDHGTPYATLRYEMLTSVENAKQLESMIVDDPQALHALTDTILLEGCKANAERWEQTGPLYDEWRASSEDGQNRIAIRHDLNAPAETSRIVAY